MLKCGVVAFLAVLLSQVQASAGVKDFGSIPYTTAFAVRTTSQR